MSITRFAQPSRLRQFELIVEKKSIFVNAHYLAELSPYFHLLCFSEAFREAREQRAEIEDELYNEVVEFMDIICPDMQYLAPKPITEKNFSLLVHFSHVMQFPKLRRELEEFVEERMMPSQRKINDETLLEMTVEAKDAQFPPTLLDLMYRKLAEVGIERVKELVKDFPVDYAESIISEIQRWTVVFPQTTGYRSCYDYNLFDRRLFL
ncbi:hypothetical protein AB6A40_005518 [Gnathostoma spinigerum]|uniref:BTB domain-containing protein n=1 Tax=Gnathostoma spinigerum TaxID=75299 RepID=A0ABD6EFN4_9BILA